MSPKTLNKFKILLLKQKEVLEKELGSIAKRDPNQKDNWNTVFPSFEPDNFDEEEAAGEVQEYINRLPLEHSLELRLREINKAIERIKKGTYGKCANCDSNISQKRLQILPETEICLKCKNKKKFKTTQNPK